MKKLKRIKAGGMYSCLVCGKPLSTLQLSISELFCGFACAQDGYLLLERATDRKEQRLNFTRLTQANLIQNLYQQIHELKQKGNN